MFYRIYFIIKFIFENDFFLGSGVLYFIFFLFKFKNLQFYTRAFSQHLNLCLKTFRTLFDPENFEILIFDADVIVKYRFLFQAL